MDDDSRPRVADNLRPQTMVALATAIPAEHPGHAGNRRSVRSYSGLEPLNESNTAREK